MAQITITSQTIRIEETSLRLVENTVAKQLARYGIGELEVSMDIYERPDWENRQVILKAYPLGNYKATLPDSRDTTLTEVILELIPIHIPGVAPDACHMIGILDGDGVFHPQEGY